MVGSAVMPPWIPLQREILVMNLASLATLHGTFKG